MSWREGIKTPYSTDSSSFYSLFSFYFHFIIFPIHRPLSLPGSCVYWYRPCFICCGLTYETYSGGGPSTYIYCMVWYHVITVLCVECVGRVFALLYTVDNEGLLHIIIILHQIKSNQIKFYLKSSMYIWKKTKISKKLFTRLYSITNNKKLYIWLKYFGTSLWHDHQMKIFNLNKSSEL